MNTPDPIPLRLASPDQSYRLDATHRAKILPGFDVDALERLLRMTRPDLRHDILKHFQKRENGERLGHLVALHDPELQKVLEEVWAPAWDEAGATDEEIESNAYGFPGREIAKQRRAARVRDRQENEDTA